MITLQESVKNIGQDLITFLQTKAPVGKVRLQIGAVLKHAPYEFFTNGCEKAWLQTGAELKDFPLEILYEIL